MLASIGDDLVRLVQDPWVQQAFLAVVLFVGALLLTRGVRRVAAELERRRALADYVRGLDEFLRGDFRDAIKALERVMERDPENVEARIALGDCYREIGNPAEAKKHHHHVHKVFGNELARNFWSLGQDELALGHYDLAVEAFERSLQLSRDESDTLWSLAHAHAEGGNSVAAGETVRRVLQKGPLLDLPGAERRRAATLLTDAAASLFAEGNAEGAVRFYTEALAFLPSDLRARAGILRAAHALGDEQRAREIVQEQVDRLRDLTSEEELLFEPARAPVADVGVPAESEASAPTFLPARVEDLGTLVAAIETKTARYRCSACGALAREHATVCGRCDVVGTLEAISELNAAYMMPLRDSGEAADEIEESAAFVQSLARKAALGDSAALERLLAMGANALYDVFAGLPAMEARRYLGACMAQLGAPAAREVRACHAARAGNGRAARAHDEFAVGFFLGMGEAGEEHFAALGPTRDAALAGALADARLDVALRDRAQKLLAAKGADALVALVEAVAAEGDDGATRRAAELVAAVGPDGVALLDRRYLQAKLLGRILGAHADRRRAAAAILGRTGMPEAAEALGRAAAREKDAVLRGHYATAKAQAESGGSA
ncbi:MAG: tetratricopeptide repeat protein [Planctomycetota bacterium]